MPGRYRYEVDYAADHAALARGDYQTTFVVVTADNEPAANLLAAQIVGSHGPIPTATRLIDGPAPTASPRRDPTRAGGSS